MSTPSRARVVSSAPAPPREIDYRAEEFEEDEPPRPVVRRKTSPTNITSFIVYSFWGAMIFSFCTYWLIAGEVFFVARNNLPPTNPARNVVFTYDTAGIWPYLAFPFGGCFGAFLWAITRTRR